MANNPLLAALQLGPARSGAAGKAASHWMNDVLWVALAGFAVFLVLALAAWWRFRRRKGGPTCARFSRRRRSRRERSGRKPPTLAEVGGLPPLRADAAKPSRPDAGQ